MLLSVPCKRNTSPAGKFQNCNNEHHMDSLQQDTRCPVLCRACQSENDTASIALQTGAACLVRRNTKHLDGLDLRNEGSCHSLGLLSQGVEEAPGQGRGALQQQICQHHPWRQVVAANAGDACREGHLLTLPLDCSDICRPLDVQDHAAADERISFAAEGGWWHLA